MSDQILPQIEDLSNGERAKRGIAFLSEMIDNLDHHEDVIEQKYASLSQQELLEQACNMHAVKELLGMAEYLVDLVSKFYIVRD